MTSFVVIWSAILDLVSEILLFSQKGQEITKIIAKSHQNEYEMYKCVNVCNLIEKTGKNKEMKEQGCSKYRKTKLFSQQNASEKRACHTRKTFAATWPLVCVDYYLFLKWAPFLFILRTSKEVRQSWNPLSKLQSIPTSTCHTPLVNFFEVLPLSGHCASFFSPSSLPDKTRKECFVSLRSLASEKSFDRYFEWPPWSPVLRKHISVDLRAN